MFMLEAHRACVRQKGLSLKDHTGTDEFSELAELRERAKLVCEATRRLIEDYYDIRAQRPHLTPRPPEIRRLGVFAT